MDKFEKVISRTNTNSVKWDSMQKVFQLEDTTDLLPMWVADMDFPAATEIIEAIQKRLLHPILGYSATPLSCRQAISNWHETRHNWTIHPESILFQHGVIPAISSVIQTFTQTGDKISITSPIYPPFFNLPIKLERALCYAPLRETHSTFTLDLQAIEQTFIDGAKLFILCNPYNPGGYVFTKQQLEALLDLCIQYDVLLLSDEIHADIVFKPSKHIPILSLEKAKKAKVIAAISPTKTFNLAGIHAAMLVIDNEQLRNEMIAYDQKNGHGDLNVFAAVAMEAAYTYGANWLDELLTYIQNNMTYVKAQLEQIDGIHVPIPNGTYLLWIDVRQFHLSEDELMHRLLYKGKVALDPGSKYATDGTGFLRMNVGAPFPIIKEGVARIKNALQ